MKCGWRLFDNNHLSLAEGARVYESATQRRQAEGSAFREPRYKDETMIYNIHVYYV